MKAVFQEPDDGQCLNACLASLVGISLEEAPRVYIWEESQKGVGSYLHRVRRFLRAHGYALIGFRDKPEVYAGAPYIACGDSPRKGEGMHAVIKIGRRIVHDPHPSGRGIVGHWFSWIVVPLWKEAQ